MLNDVLYQLQFAIWMNIVFFFFIKKQEKLI